LWKIQVGQAAKLPAPPEFSTFSPSLPPGSQGDSLTGMNSRLTRLLLSTTIGLAAAGLWLLLLTPPPALSAPSEPIFTAGASPGQPSAPAGMVFTATSGADFPDAHPGDDVCETVTDNGICTLRAAIQEANAHPGADTIVLEPNTVYQLNRPGEDDTALNGDLDITDSVNILGAGAASSIIDGNGAVTHDRVFQITGTVTISGVTIEHGRSSNFGGGLISNGRLTLINTVVYSNVVSGVNDWGGGIYSSGPLTITHSSIRENATGNHNAYGGGIVNNGPLLIINSTISGNITYSNTNTLGPGGGLYTSGYTATVVDSTFSNNTAGEGGGIYKTGYPLIIINSTIADNKSTMAGGGIFAEFGTTSLYNTTVTGNLANSDQIGTGRGGGVANAAGSTFNFINTIIALNDYVVVPGPFLYYDDCAGAITSQSNNIMNAVNAHCTITGTVTLADPRLGPLADNGGPTLTAALLPGSPAIDGGNPGGCTDNVGALITTDQRAAARPVNGCDIGAYEYGAKIPQTIAFSPLANKTFGDPSFTVSATASSGLAVTFTAAGQCNVSGSSVTLTNAGSCSISAHQAGDANYAAAPDAPQSFSIAKANQTITFGPLANKTFGDPSFSVSAIASSGLAVTFTAAGQCSVSGSSVTLTGAGSCTVTAHQAGNSNLNAASDVPQSFTISASSGFKLYLPLIVR
jgi:CSLREA domain-containing protein